MLVYIYLVRWLGVVGGRYCSLAWVLGFIGCIIVGDVIVWLWVLCGSYFVFDEGVFCKGDCWYFGVVIGYYSFMFGKGIVEIKINFRIMVMKDEVYY